MDTWQPSLWEPSEHNPAPTRIELAMAYKRFSDWKRVPPTLATKTMLKRERLYLPDDAIPAAEFSSIHGQYALYRRSDALELPPPKVHRRDYTTAFASRYSDRRAAYRDACTAMVSLNRYTKWPTCRPLHRETIYRLKNALLGKLWREGYCFSCYKVYTPKRTLYCNKCDGDGCERCSDGVYKVVGGNPFWALRYRVSGVVFSWHQPEHLAPWASPIGEPQVHQVLAEEKPIDLNPKKFAEAKALLAWVTDQPTP